MRLGKYAVPAGLALMAILPSTFVFADEVQGKAQTAIATSASESSTAAGTSAFSVDNDTGATVSLTTLDKHRGGQDVVVNDMKLNGVVSNNTAANLTTGNNSISQGSFTNASGLPLVIQNSGNNVLIQNATILNVQIK